MGDKITDLAKIALTADQLLSFVQTLLKVFEDRQAAGQVFTLENLNEHAERLEVEAKAANAEFWIDDEE